MEGDERRQFILKLLAGSESPLSGTEIADLADVYIRIPMEGKLESLNAAMAAGILMYEANRQRRT